MFNIDYQALSDTELVKRLEQGEMQSDPECYAEFIRRMELNGTVYHNTPDDEARWFADVASSVQKG